MRCRAPPLAGNFPAHRTALAELSHAWSGATDPGLAWARVAADLPALGIAFDALSRATAIQKDLAEQLVEFCNSKL